MQKTIPQKDSVLRAVPILALFGLIAGFVFTLHTQATEDPTTDPAVVLGLWATYNTGSSGFPHNTVTSSAVDGQERLWIGTLGGGIGMFDGAVWTSYTVLNTGGGLASNNISSLAASGDLVFVGTVGAGVSVYDSLSNNWTTYDTGNTSGLSSDTIEDIAIYGGTWWFATHAGLTRSFLVGNLRLWYTYTTVNSNLSDDDVLTLSLDSLGRLWIGTCGGGVDRFYDSAWVNWNSGTSGLPADCVRESVIAQDGARWFAISTTGDIHKGVVRFDGSNWVHYTPQNGDPLDGFIVELAADQANRVWMASSQGLTVFEPDAPAPRWNTYQTDDGLASNSLATVIVNGERVWAGTIGAGASVFDLNWQTLDTGTSGLVHNFVYTVLLDPGTAWFGTNGGLNRFDGTAWTTYTTSGGTLPHNQVLAIAKDGVGNYWFGTAGGIAIYDGAAGWTYQDTSNGLPHNQVNALALDSDDRMWAGTMAGAALYDGGWVVFDSSNTPLTSDNVQNLALDSQKRMWIATNGGGIGVFDGAKWEMHTSANGLPGDSVTALVSDGLGNMWAGTWGAGVGMYDGNTWTTYTTTDGLPSDVIQHLAADSLGRVWATTDDGGVALWSGIGWKTLNLRNSGLADEDVLAAGADAIGGAWFGTQGSGVSVRGSFFASIGLPTPVITGFDPTSGPAGTVVTLFGAGFDDRDPSENTVRLGLSEGLGTGLAVSSVTSTTLQIEIPPYAYTGFFHVRTGGGLGSSADQFTVLPGISDFDPQGGSPGQAVTIYGGNLQMISQVYFTQSFTPAEIVSQDPYHIQVRVPSDAVSGPIMLIDSGNNNIFTDDDFTVTQLEILGAELNQGLAGYPLIAGKDTVVNVFLGSSSILYPAYLDGVSLDVKDASGTVVYSPTAWLYNTQISVADPIASTQNGTAVFRIPGEFIPSLSPSGTKYTFTISAWIFFAGGTTEVAQFELTSNFKKPGALWNLPPDGSLHLLVMGIEDSFDFADSYSAYLGGLSTLSRLLPIPEGIGSNGGLQVTILPGRLRIPNYNCEPGDTDSWNIGTNSVRTDLVLGLLEFRRVLHNHPPFIPFPVGWSPAIMGFIHNNCTIGGTTGMAVTWPIGSSIVTLNDGQTGPTAAQELAHTFGRVPPWAPNRCLPTSGCSGGGGLTDAHSIFTVAAPVGARAYNIFTGQNISNNNPSVMSNDAGGQTDSNVLFEIGDYTCLSQWPVLCTGAIFGSVPVSAQMNLMAGTAAPASPQDNQDFVLVGFLGDESVEITDSFLSPAGSESTLIAGDEYYLVFLQGSEVLASDPFDPPIGRTHGSPDDPVDAAPLTLVRPFPAGTDRVEIRHHETVLASIEPGVAAPSITLLTPNGGESYGADEDVLVDWEASDPDGDLLTYAVSYSSDDGATYIVAAAGLTETQYLWNTAWAAGSDQALIQVTASDGFHTASDASDAAFSVAGHPPMVAIVGLEDGHVFSQHDLILLEGLALDLEDGTLSGNALNWRSDRDGSLGQGETVTVGLSLGEHTITLDATDDDGNLVSDQVTIEVQRDFDRDGLLDGYEDIYVSLNFWDPTDATADGDGDGLINLDEAFYGCHPEQPDTDGDGANDSVEVAAGSDCADNTSLPQSPDLAIGPTTLAFTDQVGGPAPDARGIEIANVGGGVLAWSADADSAWITLSPQTGTGTAVVEVSVDTSGLAPGEYEGAVTISGGPATANSPQTVTVELTLLPGEYSIYLPVALK